jgi:hypothetical protein
MANFGDENQPLMGIYQPVNWLVVAIEKAVPIFIK